MGMMQAIVTDPGSEVRLVLDEVKQPTIARAKICRESSPVGKSAGMIYSWIAVNKRSPNSNSVGYN